MRCLRTASTRLHRGERSVTGDEIVQRTVGLGDHTVDGLGQLLRDRRLRNAAR